MNNYLYEIRIKSVLNGFVVKIGCQRVIFCSYQEMEHHLSNYYKDPESTVKSFHKASCNRHLFTVPYVEDSQSKFNQQLAWRPKSVVVDDIGDEPDQPFASTDERDTIPDTNTNS